MNNEMWENENFIIANGMSELGNPLRTYDANPFDYFEGGLDETIDDEFSDATGSRRRAKRRIKKTAKGSRVERRGAVPRRNPMASTRQNLSDRRTARTVKKRTFQDNQNRKIADVNKQAEADAKLLASLSTTITPPVEPKKMSSTLKNALFIGGTAVAIVIGVVLFKKFRKK
jgi:hypothetical protein